MQNNLQKYLEHSQADACIVAHYSTTIENIRWANTSTTTNGITHDEDILVISVIGRSVGVVTETLTEDTDIPELFKKSEELARQNPENEDFISLVEDRSQSPTAELPDTSINSISGPLESVFEKARKQQLDIFGYAELKTVQIEMVNSKGLHKISRGRTGQIELNAKDLGRTSSVWEGQSINVWEDQNIVEMFNRLQQKMDWSNTKIDLEPGKFTVVLEPSAVTDLLVYAYWESAARDADEGRTVFSTVANQPNTFSKNINIYSDPNEPGFEYPDFVKTAASSSHESVFDNGATITKFDWIKHGEVTNLFAPRFYAHKTKRKPVFFGENLIFNSDGNDVPGLIKNVKNGLLITCFWYIREVDPQSLLLTGLTRDGVFVIKNGKVIGAANNFRFNMSPITMLQNTTEIGKSTRTLAREFGDYFTRTKIPPLIVENFNMSTKSDAL